MMYNVLNFTPEYAKELYDLIDPNYYITDEVQLLKVYIDYPPLELGDKYYNFKAEDSNRNEVKFSEYFDGKYVMLDFSTLNCGFCQEAAPKTAVIADSLKDQVTYVTFYTGNDKKDKHKYYSELKGNKGILLSHSDNELFKIITMYRMTGTPSYFLFNPEGYLIEKLKGIQDDDFQEKIEELISK